MSDTMHHAAPKTPDQITADVLASFDGSEDARLREIMQALVRHLHGFRHAGRFLDLELGRRQARARDLPGRAVGIYDEYSPYVGRGISKREVHGVLSLTEKQHTMTSTWQTGVDRCTNW